MPAPDLKTAQEISHATAAIVEDAVGELDRRASAEVERGNIVEALDLGLIGEALSREAERLRAI